VTITPPVINTPLGIGATTNITVSVKGVAAPNQVCFKLVPITADPQCCSSDNICFNVLDCDHHGIAPTTQQEANEKKKP
jgi:hypothetical protein